MSGLATALLINGVVLAVVLEADLGAQRRISRFRVVRPLVTAALIVPFYLKGVSHRGTGLLLEIAFTVAGLLLGLGAGKLLEVYRSPRTGKPASRAGLGYAALWIVVIGVRTAFSVGSVDWFGPQLGHWMASNCVASAALTDSLIFMAIAMLATRTVSLGVRGMNLPRQAR